MNPLDDNLKKELHSQIKKAFMKPPPTPPEPRKVYGDGRPSIPNSNPGMSEPTKLGLAFWVSVVIAFIVTLVWGIAILIA